MKQYSKQTDFRKRLILLVSAIILATVPLVAAAQELDVPHKVHVLKNGLQLIVNEDHKAPIVAVHIWYHVGSKDETSGKTGFAHLFEHLMFNGTENYNDEYFGPLQKLGAVVNGSTWFDRTNYFQIVPKHALDLVLWMESDRMGHLLGAIDQAKLDEQRGVVQNEKRQGENNPYGQVEHVRLANLYPENHHYSWSTIGSMEDLGAASLEDVHAWFKAYYGAANAVLSISGDVDTDEVIAKVERFFGDIEPGPPVTKMESWVPRWKGTKHVVMEVKAPLPSVQYTWNVPRDGSLEGNRLDMVATILGQGETSRLYQRLVKEEQIVSRVSANCMLFEIAGTFTISATAKPGVALDRIEAVIDEELAKFIDEGPTDREVLIVKKRQENGLIRGFESVNRKASALASNLLYHGRPDYYKVTSQYVQTATKEDLHRLAQEWLSDSLFKLELVPFGQLQTVSSDVDRSKLPEPGTPPAAKFPDFQRASLANGLDIIVAERHEIPVVNFVLNVKAGSVSEQYPKIGVAGLAFSMLTDGTTSRTGEEISDELDILGVNFNASGGADSSSVYFSLLKKNFEPSLQLCVDLLFNPTYPQKEFDLYKSQMLANLIQRDAMPGGRSREILAEALYGKGHPFSTFSTPETIQALAREDLVEFHSTWLRPNVSTLIVVGDTTMDEIKPLVKKYFGGWEQADLPETAIPQAPAREKSLVFIYDHPGATQSRITAARVMPQIAQDEEIALKLANDILGGNFSSRINMNLRENKHWTYGARSFYATGAGPRQFGVSSPVQIDKTKDAVLEMLKELDGYCGDNPITEDELDRARNDNVLKLGTQWESARVIAFLLADMINRGLPGDYFETYAANVLQVQRPDIIEVSAKAFDSGNLVWMIVGDRSVIEDDIRALDLGEVIVLDAQGNEVNQ